MALTARGVMKGASTAMWRLKNCARRPSMADAAERMLVLCSCRTWHRTPATFSLTEQSESLTFFQIRESGSLLLWENFNSRCPKAGAIVMQGTCCMPDYLHEMIEVWFSAHLLCSVYLLVRLPNYEWHLALQRHGPLHSDLHFCIRRPWLPYQHACL